MNVCKNWFEDDLQLKKIIWLHKNLNQCFENSFWASNLLLVIWDKYAIVDLVTEFVGWVLYILTSDRVLRTGVIKE